MTEVDDKVRCPKCGSDQVHAAKRGWSIWTCLKCGNKFSPGQG